MLSAIVICPEAGAGRPATPEMIVRSLAPLVGASIAGVVRDVVLAGPAGAELEAIGEHAGCHVASGADEAAWLAVALGAARCPHLFVLRAGFVPEAGFVEELEDLAPLVATTTLLMRAMPQSLAERLAPRLAPVAAVVLSADRCRGAAGFAALARVSGPKRLLRSHARLAV